jgi:hypothetical protein
MNPVNNFVSYFPDSQFNIDLLPTSMSPK